MNLKKIFSLCVFLLVFGHIAGVLSNEKKQVDKIITFNLKDQFDKTHTNTTLVGTNFILLGSDRKGGKYSPLWSKAIKESLKNEKWFNQFKIIRVANTKGAPKFIRKIIKSKFKKATTDIALLDWEGVFAKNYSWIKKINNIMIFNKVGKLLYRTTAKEPTDDKLGEIVKVIKDSFK